MRNLSSGRSVLAFAVLFLSTSACQNLDTTTLPGGTGGAGAVGGPGAPGGAVIPVPTAPGATPVPIPPLSVSAEYRRGVPHPRDYFGRDPLTFDLPVTRTVAAFPETVVAGESVLVTSAGGATGTVFINFDCTAERPCMLKGNGLEVPVRMFVSGKHYTIDGFVRRMEGGTLLEVINSEYGVIRNCEHVGTNTTRSGTTSITSNNSKFMVFYKNHIHNIGDTSPAYQVDHIGFVVRHNARYYWYLDNDANSIAGDSIRTGTNVSHMDPGQVAPDHLFIANNRFGNNAENPIDLKWSTDIVISGNELAKAIASVSGSGTGIAIHESADRIHILSNLIKGVNRGMASTTAGGGANYWKVDGNTFEDIRDIGVYNRAGAHVDVTNNVFINVTAPIVNNVNNGSTVTESGNVIR